MLGENDAITIRLSNAYKALTTRIHYVDDATYAWSPTTIPPSSSRSEKPSFSKVLQDEPT